MDLLHNGLGSLDPRTPVVVGVGTASGHAEATDLMTRALVAAGSDAGSPRLLERIDWIAVPQGSWSYPDPGRLAAGGVGAAGARTHLYELGIPQQRLINDALVAITTGASEVAAVVGGEAKRWARDEARSGIEATETDQPGAIPDVTHRREGALLEPVEVANRLWDPVQQYAMIDNALRAADRRTLRQHRAEVADLWSRFNLVARTNPDAAFPAPMDAQQIDTPSVTNRPLAFPYNKWHSTQWTVNQSAALLLCSAEMAVRLGVGADQWAFPQVGLESSHAVSLLRRKDPHTWPAMDVLARAAETRIGRPIADADIIEVYSCFPAAVRVQQRCLGLEPGTTPTITGGMAFAGGPFNNFVLQATAAMIAAIRAEPGALGAVTTVSGLLTKTGIGVWSGRPDGRLPLVADLAPAAHPETGVVDVVESLDGYTGAATVATYTVTYEELVPARTLALCDTADGRRCVAISGDGRLAAHAVSEELIGAHIEVAGGSFDLR
jgi:acetyl-CoA C-acetyltransferase